VADTPSGSLCGTTSDPCECGSGNVFNGVNRSAERPDRPTLPYSLDGSNFFRIESKRLTKGGALMKSQPAKRPE
jgi:hypothetical protein